MNLKCVPFAVALSCITLFCGAQNLVPNPSFELYSHPCSLGVGYQHLVNWSYVNCTNGAGILSTCNGFSSGVPNNLSGYSYPKTGDAYAMAITFAPMADNDNPRHYISVPLAQTLTAGLEYCVALWASLGDSSTHTTQALHCYLTNGPLSTCNNEDFNWDQSAQVTFDITSVDSSQWHLLQGSFIANGGENQLTIGSFLFNNEIDTVFLQPSYFVQSIYFIDDVYLGPCNAVGVAERNERDLSVYPNPASEYVFVDAPKDMHKGVIRLHDMSGRMLLERAMSSALERFDISDLANGVYQVVLVDKEGGVEAVSKLMKRD